MEKVENISLTERLRKSLQGRKDLADLAKGIGCHEDFLYKFRRGETGIGADLAEALRKAVHMPAPGRHRAHILRREIPRVPVFTDVPSIPDDFEVSEEEARLIFDRRKTGDPLQCFRLALDELRIGMSGMPDSAVRSRIEARTAIAVLEEIVRGQEERGRKAKDRRHEK